LYEKKPFKKISLDNFKKAKKPKDSKSADGTSKLNKHIISPNLNSKFSPSISISKSPLIYKRNLEKLKISNTYINDDDSRDLLRKFAKMKTISIAKNILLKYAQTNLVNPLHNKGISIKEIPVEKGEITKTTINEKLSYLNKLEDIPENKNFSSRDEKEQNENLIENSNKKLSDLTIGHAVKYKVHENLIPQSQQISDMIYNLKISEDQESSSEERVITEYEGYIYKITNSNNLRRLWFKLAHKDLYCKYTQ
jgi:hypothetical protein